MKTIKKLAAMLLLMLLVFSMGSGIAASAENSYSIPSLVVDAVINDDGSVSITETWKVKFISGSFSRFYHDISTEKLPTDESFSGIRDVSVFIDGVECDFTEDTANRPDYHYNIDGSSQGARLAAYLKSANCTRTYVFNYTLDGVVKRVDGDYYLFVYRFVGDNFEQDINNLTIHVMTPAGSTSKVLYHSNGKETVIGNSLQIHASSNSDSMFKLRVRMDGCTIPGAVDIRSNQLSNSKETARTIALIIVDLLIAVLFAGSISAIAVYSRRQKKAKKMLKQKGTGYIRELIVPLRGIFSPAELSYAVGYRSYSFMLQLLTLTASGRVESSFDSVGRQTIYIPKTSDGAQNMAEAQTIRAISAFCAESGIPLSQKGYALELDTFAEYVAANCAYSHNINVEIEALIGRLVKDKMSKKAKKDIKALRTAVNNAVKMSMIPTVNEKQLVDSYADHETMLYYAASKFHGDRNYPISDCSSDSCADTYDSCYSWYYLSDSFDKASADYAASHAGSDSGSGCSSCSSCSSCGGGGAD